MIAPEQTFGQALLSSKEPHPAHTKWLTDEYNKAMTTQIAVRLNDAEIEALDAEVAQGRAANRSEALRRSIAHLQRQQRHRNEESSLLEIARRGECIYPDLDAILDQPIPPMD